MPSLYFILVGKMTKSIRNSLKYISNGVGLLTDDLKSGENCLTHLNKSSLTVEENCTLLRVFRVHHPDNFHTLGKQQTAKFKK